jgi:putative transposase
MPWVARSIVEERYRFVEVVESGEYSVTEACRVFGISRPTGYKWLRRYAEEGWEGLRDRSRAPHSCPHRTSERAEREILEAWSVHSDWGPKKLRRWWLRRHRGAEWPAASTVGVVLERNGRTRKRRRRASVSPHPGRPRVEAGGPNELWTSDFKGEFRTRDGRWCYPLTVADQSSRYLLGCRALPSTGMIGVRPTLERIFAEYGLPRAILTDNGPPFASAAGLGRLSRLSVWWIRLGIVPLLIEPGHPEQNGRHERMHRTLKLRLRPAAASCRGQQRIFDRFRAEFNDERPHEGLGGRTPADVYRASPRPFPRQLPPLEYASDWEVRRVCGNGCMKWHDEFVFISRVLIGEYIGLRETGDGIWSVSFGPRLLGKFSERDWKFRQAPAPAARRAPRESYGLARSSVELES